LDWEKLFKLEPAEHCDAYVEDLSTPDRWWELLTVRPLKCLYSVRHTSLNDCHLPTQSHRHWV
jgi:hypothetical protein